MHSLILLDILYGSKILTGKDNWTILFPVKINQANCLTTYGTIPFQGSVLLRAVNLNWLSAMISRPLPVTVSGNFRVVGICQKLCGAMHGAMYSL